MFKIKIWGARGSMSVFGPEYKKYSGNTSCVEVNLDNKSIIFDGGTGIIKLGKKLTKSNLINDINIFFTHYHYDHIIGLFNFLPIYNQKASINFYGQNSENKSVKELISNIFTYPYYPLKWDALLSNIKFTEINENSIIQFLSPLNKEIKVIPISTIHPNKNLAYKILYNSKSFVYLTDFAHYKEEEEKIINFTQNADLVIYDSNFTPEEYEMKMYEGWGHSNWLKATELANKANIKKLILFHHKVDRTDLELENILKESKKHFKNTFLAREEDEYIL